MSPVSAQRWRCMERAAIVWRQWDDEFVVRNERSGSTHLLGNLPGAVLQVLLDADHPLRIEDIATRLEAQQAAPAAPSLLAAIDETLNEFHRLELAEPAPQ